MERSDPRGDRSRRREHDLPSVLDGPQARFPRPAHVRHGPGRPTGDGE